MRYYMTLTTVLLDWGLSRRRSAPKQLSRIFRWDYHYKETTGGRRGTEVSAQLLIWTSPRPPAMSTQREPEVGLQGLSAAPPGFGHEMLGSDSIRRGGRASDREGWCEASRSLCLLIEQDLQKKCPVPALS